MKSVASNTEEQLSHLVGAVVMACFRDDNGRVWIVTKDGDALVFGGGPSPDSGPAFWHESKHGVQMVVGRRKADIEMKLAQLRAMPGVQLP